jgi:hypothetical protein
MIEPEAPPVSQAHQRGLKSSGMAQLTVPVVVWDVLKDDDALTREWHVTIEEGEGASPEFTLNQRRLRRRPRTSVTPKAACAASAFGDHH